MSSYGVKVIVHDASVLIDLATADVLEPWFSLGFEAVITRMVWGEINRKSQKEKIQPYIDKGQLKIASLGSEAITSIALLRSELSPDISIEDASALFVAISRKGILLTGEKTLRQNAEKRGVDVHGLLWVFDILIERGKLLASVAADRLEYLAALRTSRLPKDSCNERIRKWRNQ
jgi:predicted nucleic acid-binding protein